MTPSAPLLRVEVDRHGEATLFAQTHLLLRGRLVCVPGLTAAVAPARDDLPGLVRLTWRGNDGTVLRVVAGIAAEAPALVWRAEAVHAADVARTVEVATALAAAVPKGAALHLPVGALVVETGTGAGFPLWLAHTLVPDAGADDVRAQDVRNADAGADGAPGGVDRGTGGRLSLRRVLVVPPGAAAGLTGVVGVGATARAAVEAAFPHLSGERSRAALRTAHRVAAAAAVP